MQLVGNAVVRLELPEKGKESGPEILVRLKIFRLGSCNWNGIFLEAPALECSPEGLGYRTVPDAHVLDGLGIHMKRSEDMSCLRGGSSIFTELTGEAHVSTDLGMAAGLEAMASPFDSPSTEIGCEVLETTGELCRGRRQFRRHLNPATDADNR